MNNKQLLWIFTTGYFSAWFIFGIKVGVFALIAHTSGALALHYLNMNQQDKIEELRNALHNAVRDVEVKQGQDISAALDKDNRLN